MRMMINRSVSKHGDSNNIKSSAASQFFIHWL